MALPNYPATRGITKIGNVFFQKFRCVTFIRWLTGSLRSDRLAINRVAVAARNAPGRIDQ
jgi:hypothetical protein